MYTKSAVMSCSVETAYELVMALHKSHMLQVEKKYYHCFGTMLKLLFKYFFMFRVGCGSHV